MHQCEEGGMWWPEGCEIALGGKVGFLVAAGTKSLNFLPGRKLT